MKKVNVFVLGLTLCASAFALAQIPGAVGFKLEKQIQSENVATDTAPAQLDKRNVDARALLAKRIKKQRIWDNPRFTKDLYGSLKGMQNSIEKAQNEELEKKEYASQEDKEKALEKIKSQAIVRFDDFNETPDVIHQKMNENPRAQVLEMSERLDYIKKDKMTSGFSNHIQDEIKTQFLQRNGVTMDEYQNATQQQMLNEYEQRLAEKDKVDSFPPLSIDNQVSIEKIDEQNALLVVGVKAPVSKK